ncbi:MAG: hypothetical protein GY813_13080 [Halieaceae bacterium]|nr:hypothetical protein [Halieaceae bacterium]
MSSSSLTTAEVGGQGEGDLVQLAEQLDGPGKGEEQPAPSCRLGQVRPEVQHWRAGAHRHGRL